MTSRDTAVQSFLTQDLSRKARTQRAGPVGVHNAPSALSGLTWSVDPEGLLKLLIMSTPKGSTEHVQRSQLLTVSMILATCAATFAVAFATSTSSQVKGGLSSTVYTDVQRATLRPLPREHNISFGEFRRKYLSTSTPVVLTGVMDDWEAGVLSRDELNELCGSGPVFGYCGDPSQSQIKYHAQDFRVKWASLEVVPSRDDDASLSNLSALLAAQQNAEFSLEVRRTEPAWFGMTSRTHVTSVQGRELYLHDAPIHHHCPALLSKLRSPRFFPVNYIKQLGFGSGASRKSGCGPFGIKPSMFVGAGGSQSGLHIDAQGTRFWMAVLSGTKTWRVVTPQDAWGLKRRNPTTCDLRTLQLMRELKIQGPAHGNLHSELCPGFGIDLFSGDGADGSGPITREPTIVYEANVTAGELIFIPELHAHQVKNLDATIAISNNFLDDYSFEAYIMLADALLQFYMAVEKSGVGAGGAIGDALRATGRRLTQAGFARDGLAGFPWYTSESLPVDLKDTSWEEYAQHNTWRGAEQIQAGETATAAQYDAAFKDWVDSGGHLHFFAALDSERERLKR